MAVGAETAVNATDELRAELTKRGVEYVVDDGKTVRITHWKAYGEWVIFIEYDTGETQFCTDMRLFTPEQAIAATVGDIDATDERQGDAGTCKLDDFADVPFSVDYEIEGYDMDSGRDYATLAECSACGAYIIVPPEYHHVLTCDGDEVYQPYRFCPSCGRRIV